jgi:hypothetical protein
MYHVTSSVAYSLGESHVSRYWTGRNLRTLDFNGSCCYSGDVAILTVVVLQSGMRIFIYLQSWCCKAVCESLFYFIIFYFLAREVNIPYGILAGKSLEKFP